ncbi:MAG: DUF3616 domain-containing protein, partial [Hypericibacter sp.]
MKPSSVRLDYGPLGSVKAGRQQHLLNNISTVAQAGEHLWLASDEGCTVERLSWDGRGYARAVSYDLSAYFSLPKGGPEIDVEALSIDRDRLWIAGSHSRVRQAPPSPSDSECRPRKFLESLTTVKRRPRRYLIGQLHLSAQGGKIVSAADGTAPCVAFDRTGNSLTRALREDPHLAPFLGLPDKENGLDIEGLGAKDYKIFLGLRGPVIRGYAVILQLSVEIQGSTVRLAGIGAGSRRYRKFFLDLGGLGVRDLTVVGEDLVIVAGPTMGLDGPWSVLRWRNAFGARREGLVDKDALRREPGLTFEGPERPEGITRLLHPDGRRGWLVVYDRPDPKR